MAKKKSDDMSDEIRKALVEHLQAGGDPAMQAAKDKVEAGLKDQKELIAAIGVLLRGEAHDHHHHPHETSHPGCRCRYECRCRGRQCRCHYECRCDDRPRGRKYGRSRSRGWWGPFALAESVIVGGAEASAHFCDVIADSCRDPWDDWC